MGNIEILIIEDDKIITLHIVKILKKIGIKNIHKATSSDEVFNIIKNYKINIVLSDIRINDHLDGIDIAQTISSLYSIPIIFISAYKDSETLARASKIDFFGYLLKPFRQEELEVLITLAISKYNLSYQNNILEINKYYKFNLDNQMLFYLDEEIKLTPKEKLAINILVNKINSYVSYETFEAAVWLDRIVIDNSRRIFIYRLKNKLQKLDIRTEKYHGIGLFNN